MRMFLRQLQSVRAPRSRAKIVDIVLRELSTVEERNDPEEVCSICLETLEGEHETKQACSLAAGESRIIKLKCDHLFHHECIKTWFSRPYDPMTTWFSCPYCRQNALPLMLGA